MKRSRAEDSGDEVAERTRTKRSYPRRPCLICDTEKGTNQFVKSAKLSSHDHGSDVCRHCYRKHIENEIDTKPWDQIACAQCTELLTYEEVKLMTCTSYFKKYDRAALRAALSADADFRYCMSTACQSGQLHPGGTDEPIFRCENCASKHCTVCEVPWHEDETCEQYEDRRKLEKLRLEQNETSEKTVKQISKPCPKCKVKTEKDEGCDHMTCSRCRHHYCWLCFANYRNIFRDGNHRHEEDCPHYRDPPARPTPRTPVRRS